MLELNELYVDLRESDDNRRKPHETVESVREGIIVIIDINQTLSECLRDEKDYIHTDVQ